MTAPDAPLLDAPYRCGIIHCEDEWVSWLQSALVMLLFFVFLYWQRRVHPFAFPFQNFLEQVRHPP